jgi:hypothetical protein
MNPLSQRSHCTQFMLDFVPYEHKKQKNSFQDYMKREGNYDLSFCESWLNHVNADVIGDAEKLLEFFMKIQKTAMKHIELIGKISEGQKYQSGIFIGNRYDVGKELNSDAEGIKKLARQIWFRKREKRITIFSEEKGPREIYFLENEGFFKNIPNKLPPKLIDNDGSEKLFNSIFDKILNCYDKGHLKDGSFPLIIQSTYFTVEGKKNEAFKLFNKYLTSIKENKTNEEKIRSICKLCRELEQLHLFHDGNGRSVFILANLLLGWNGLDPFYPQNMCVFDANSLEKMFQEVVEGQERFAFMFGSKAQFNKDLNIYKQEVERLALIVNKKFSKLSLVTEPFKERNFNLLLRQSAANKITQEILEFLLQNLSSLNIDINSKGKTSGTVMDVAINNKNEEAISLLKKYV